MSPDAVLALLRGEEGIPRPRDVPAWEALARRLGDESLTGVALARLQASGQLEQVPPSARRMLEADLNRPDAQAARGTLVCLRQRRGQRAPSLAGEPRSSMKFPQAEKARMDRVTVDAIAGVAGSVANRIDKHAKPEVAFPVRALGNVHYDPKRGYFQRSERENRYAP